MADETGFGQIDARIVGVLRGQAAALARRVVEAHDCAYPASNLRSIPLDERLRWVESWFGFFADCVEAGEFEPWEYSYLAAISENFEPGLPPYYRIGDCYENALPMEGVALPFVWQEFLSDPDDVRLRALARLHDLFQMYMRVNTEPLYAQVAAYERDAVQEVRQHEREAWRAYEAGVASGPVADLGEKVAQARDAVEAGDAARALALLTVCKLQLAEMQSQLERGGPSSAPVPASQAPGDATGGDAGCRAVHEAPLPSARCAVPRAGEHAAGCAANAVERPLAQPSAPAAPRPAVSARELTLLHEVAQGKTNAEIARDLGLSLGTVRNYISTAMVKLGADNRAQLVVLAIRQGILA